MWYGSGRDCAQTGVERPAMKRNADRLKGRTAMREERIHIDVTSRSDDRWDRSIDLAGILHRLPERGVLQRGTRVSRASDPPSGPDQQRMCPLRLGINRPRR